MNDGYASIRVYTAAHRQDSRHWARHHPTADRVEHAALVRAETAAHEDGEITYRETLMGKERDWSKVCLKMGGCTAESCDCAAGATDAALAEKNRVDLEARDAKAAAAAKPA